MDRYSLMDERELLRAREEEEQKNALLQMMRYGAPGKFPVRKAPYQPLTLMDHLRRAYEGAWEEPKTHIIKAMAVRG